jgi:SNF2-related domain
MISPTNCELLQSRKSPRERYNNDRTDLLFSRIIDFSQSCARETDNGAWGSVRCITPSSNPYHSYRGGPLVGAEALILQGIPREKLLLNRESSKQLVDLAGNAMTSTVVGAAILAALISCGKILTKALDRPKKSLKSPGESLRFTLRLEYDPKWQLIKTDLTVHLRSPITADMIRSLAVATMRLCSCEGLICNASQIFQQCSRCGHTSCVSCGIKPKHHYTTIGALMNRTSAIDFESRIREALPPRLAIRGIFTAHLEAASASHARLGRDYTVAIEAAAAGECRLVSVKRDQGLSVVYEGRRSRLVLTCERKWDGRVLRSEAFDKLTSAMTLQWRFFVKPCPELPANSQIRKDLQHPIARLTCLESLFEGRWEVRATPEESFALEITGSGDKVPSWEKRQGLEDPLFKNSFVWPTLEVRIPAGSSLPTVNIPEHMFGQYDLHQDCGTACGSLHVKQKTSVSDTEEPLFLFLDPDPLGNASYDSFVFANQHHRLGVKEARVSLAKIEAGWRPLGTSKVSRVTCQVSSEWVPVDNVNLSEHAPNDLQKVYLAPPEIVLPVNGPSCDYFGVPVVWCEFSTTKEAHDELALKSQEHIGLVKNPFSLKPLSWLLKKIGHAMELTEWQCFPLPTQISSRCEICAPTPPGVVWESVGTDRDPHIRPHENMLEACKYERNVKEAPEAATAQVSYRDDSALAALTVNFNVLNLVHKAVAALSDSQSSFLAPSTIHWRAVVDHGYNYPVPFPQIQLKNCQDHLGASQPPSFRAHERELNESQLRSLDWMIGQEKQPGKVWEEQEIAEALISPMSLRLEAKVTARRHVSGGVLADDVGYGKTALVLALIDSDFQKMEAMSPPAFTPGADDMVKLKATLILMPANLTKQWRDEIEKFMGDTYNVLFLTKNNFAEKSRISTFQEADIILATWDLFDDAYFAKLAQMSRARFTPASAGRGFEEWFRMAQQDLKTLIKNSHGLKANRLSSTWYGLNKNKYDKFAGFSKRNKKGGEAPTDAEDEPAPKKLQTTQNEVDDVEIEVPTVPYLPLHGCIFRRIVVDEFTYVGDKQLPAIVAFQAIRRWILSGTPPINTFEGASSMANFLGTTIGVPDDAALRYRKVKSSKVTHVTSMLLLSIQACYWKTNVSQMESYFGRGQRLTLRAGTSRETPWR